MNEIIDGNENKKKIKNDQLIRYYFLVFTHLVIFIKLFLMWTNHLSLFIN